MKKLFFLLTSLLILGHCMPLSAAQYDVEEEMTKVFLNYSGSGTTYTLGINGYVTSSYAVVNYTPGNYILWVIPGISISTTDAYCSNGQYVLNGTYSFNNNNTNSNTCHTYWGGNILTTARSGSITFTYRGNSYYDISIECESYYNGSVNVQVGWYASNVRVELDAAGPLNHPTQTAEENPVDITIASPALDAISQKNGNVLRLSVLGWEGTEEDMLSNPFRAAYMDFIVNTDAYNAKYLPSYVYNIGTSGTPRVERGNKLCRSNDFGFYVWRFIPVSSSLANYYTSGDYDYSDLASLWSGTVTVVNPNHTEIPMYVQVDALNSESETARAKLYGTTYPNKYQVVAIACEGASGTPTINCAEGYGYTNSTPSDLSHGAVGTGEYYYNGTHITLTAPAASYGYMFSKWQKDGADFSGNTSTDVSFDVSSNATYSAIYNPAPSYTVTLGSPTGGTFSGSITELSTTIVSGSSYYSGAHLVFDATADVANGYQLKQWNVTNGGSTTTYTSNPLNLTLTSNITVTPIFVQQTSITTDYAYLVRSSYSGSSTINIRGRNNDYEVSVGLTATSLTQTGSVTFRSDATNSYILDLATGTKTTFSSGDNLTITRTGTSSDYTYTLTGTLNGGEYGVTMAYKDPSGASNEYGSASTFNQTFSNITIGGSGTTRTITASSGSSSSQRRISVELYVPSGTGNQVIPTGIYYVQSGSSANTIKQSSGRSGSKNNYTYNTSWCKYSSSGNNYIYFRRGIMEIINVGNKTTPDYIRSDVQNSSGYPITFTYGTKPALRTVNISAENGTVGLSANSDPVGGKYYNGTTITLTPDAADGFEFDSWSGGSPTDNGDGTYTITLSADVNLTANFIEYTAPSTYTVEFDAGEGTGSMSNQEVEVGETVNLTANEFTGPSITVYYEYNDATGGNSKASETVNSTFLGWDGSDGEFYEDEAEITDITSAGETVTMTAQWMFNSITLPTPTKTGHTFLAWEGTFGGMNLSEDAGAEVSVKEGGTFTAQWEINKHTVTVNTNPSGYGTVRIGSGAEQAQVEIANVPHFSTFTTPSTGTIVINGNTVTATPATVAGYTYTFQNWTNALATVTDDIDVTANFTRSLIPYTITYNLNDGTNTVSPAPATSYNVETATITLPTPTKEGYNFLGWYANSDLTTGGVVTTIPVGSYGNKEFWAKWEAKTYAITYNKGANGTGADIDAGEKTYNVDFILSNSTFTRTGYTQTGWSINADGSTNDYTLGGTYTGNTALDLYPYWEINTYTVTVAKNNNDYGTLTNESENVRVINNVPYGSTFTVDANKVTINGTTVTATPAANDAQYSYAFSGWTNGAATVTDAMTVTANFTRTTRTYDITWKSEDGTSTLETDPTQAYGTATAYNGATIPTKTVTGYTYTFDGWTTEPNGAGTFYANGETPAVGGAATYYAHFTGSANTHTLTWVANGGTLTGGTAAGTTAYGTALTAPTATRAGYTFNGWSPSVPATMPDDNATYTAQWNIVPYTITYGGLNGETNTNPDTYTIESEDINLVAPGTRDGYIFAGWKDESNNTITQIAKGSTGNRTLTATWNVKSSNIELCEDCNDAHYNAFKDDYNNETVNVTYNRQFAEGRWSTMCLPFSLDLATMIANNMYGRVYEFKYATGNANVGEGVNLYFSNAKSIEAGKCYIVNANSALAEKTSFVFSGVTIDLTNDKVATLTSVGDYNKLPGYNSQGTIKLVGTLRNGTLQGSAKDNTYMGLKNNKIYYPNTTAPGSTIWAYRGIFRSSEILDKESMQKMRIIVDGEDRGELIIDADGDILAPSDAQSRKFIRDGVLYIEREGVVYDAQGKRVEGM